jgi:hypothetical protein
MKKLLILAGILAAVKALSLIGEAYSADCTLRSCSNGGPIVKCWEKLKVEHQAKLRSCGVVKIKTGYSAYAMASGLPNTCIERDASLYLHLPYGRGYKTRPIATNYYRSRIKATVWAKFIAKGGAKRSGVSNAWFMTRVPANETGIPVCGDEKK